MSDCLVIPTYWSTSDSPSWKTFDHPIPVDEEGTLGRTLKNLEEVAYPSPIALFPVPDHPRIEEKVRGIAAGRNLDIRIVGSEAHAKMKGGLESLGFPEDLLQAVDRDSYGGVRNEGLLFAAFQGFENIVMIDDDECVEDTYRSCALRYMGERKGRAAVLGKTGCVTDERGRKIYDGQSSAVLSGWPKDELFNEAVRRELSAPETLTPCTVAFGGNMVLNRHLFLHVPFDPYGARGEDDDYVLNARHEGYPFFFDRDLVLLHLPPARGRSFWTRQRQDIVRFRYLREKVRRFGFSPASLGPFLGYFTADDLEYKAVSTSIQAALQFMDSDREEFREFLNNALVALSPPTQELKARVDTFLRFQDAWRTYIPKIWSEG